MTESKLLIKEAFLVDFAIFSEADNGYDIRGKEQQIIDFIINSDEFSREVTRKPVEKGMKLAVLLFGSPQDLKPFVERLANDFKKTHGFFPKLGVSIESMGFSLIDQIFMD